MTKFINLSVKQLLNDDLLHPKLAEQLKTKVTELHNQLKKSPVAARADIYYSSTFLWRLNVPVLIQHIESLYYEEN
jgi:hypothetical protein